ncbi:MAG TPA: S1C family serine protease [Alphaproteobacteria bacterium]|nr:S1C family serine protease [Alphaproteobacteria bacterium]
MPSLSEWKVPEAAQPKPGEYGYDLDQTLAAVVGVKATVPDDAFTAEILGTERAGNGAVINNRGLVLTIGYLITEAESIWLTTVDGRVLPGTVVGYDQATGFGLIQALGRLDLPALKLGNSADATLGERVVVAGAGGRDGALAARVVARQEFAGYWEYVIDEAIFTAPAHPHWGGAAVIGSAGELIGIGSLQLEAAVAGKAGQTRHLNMIVPIDLLKPILHDMVTTGRAGGKPRPWLGLYATEIDDKIAIAGLASNGPAQRAGIRAGDIITAVDGAPVSDLADFFRQVWSMGEAGVAVPLTVYRERHTFEVTVTSTDRNKLLKGPRLQ